MTRKAKILSRLKSYLRFNDLSAMRWWVTPNHALNSLTPEQYSQKPGGYKFIEDLIGFSEIRLDDFCTKDTGPCAKCDAVKVKKRSAWDRILGRRPEISSDTVATKTNSGTVATRSNDDTVAT